MDNTLNIVMVITIILFARLGMRLLIGYKKSKKEDGDNEESDD